MKLATLAEGGRDGCLVVVSRDGSRYAPATKVVPTMQEAIEQWADLGPQLARIAEDLETGQAGQVSSIAGVRFAAPLPRAWQWLDGSAFQSHGELMDKVIGISPEKTGRPLMYQGVSDRFYGPTDDVPMRGEDDGIDFEGEFGVIVDEVPMGTLADAAFEHIKLVVLINDWSLRALAGPEMKTGFGWVQAKPPCSMAPFAITPDELGNSWRNGRVCLDLRVDRGGDRFGDANGELMGFGFHELVAHAAATRRLVAGTVIGSGTVSNPNFREVGSSCIAERRGIEIVDEGKARTPFMHFGERVRMEARLPDGTSAFGVIDQKVVKA